MSLQIRTAAPGDAAAILRVYAPYIERTTVSFELAVPAVDEFDGRIAETLDRYAYLVLEELPDGNAACGLTVPDAADRAAHIVGFAYYGAFGHRAAYQWSAETSIYLAPELCGRGLGTILIDALERLMAAQGIVNAEACICAENAGSIAFHERHGYIQRAMFPSCAHKLGRWLGIVWLEKRLGEAPALPSPIRPLDAGAAARVIAAANAKLAGLDR